MREADKSSIKETGKIPFAQKYPRINLIIGLILLLTIIFIGIWMIEYVFSCLESGIEQLVIFFKKVCKYDR